MPRTGTLKERWCIQSSNTTREALVAKAYTIHRDAILGSRSRKGARSFSVLETGKGFQFVRFFPVWTCGRHAFEREREGQAGEERRGLPGQVWNQRERAGFQFVRFLTFFSTLDLWTHARDRQIDRERERRESERGSSRGGATWAPRSSLEPAREGERENQQMHLQKHQQKLLRHQQMHLLRHQQMHRGTYGSTYGSSYMGTYRGTYGSTD